MPVLATILEHAAARVPRYQGLRPVLTDFPVMHKQSVTDNLVAYISDELGSEKQKLVEFLLDENRPRGKNDESLFGPRIVVEETSGSSGIPFRIAKTLEERAALSFAIWKYRKKYDPLCSPANFYPFIHRPANIPSKGKSRDFTRPNIDKLYRRLGADGFRWIHGGARLLRRHAEVISAEVAQTLSIRFVENSGEPLSTDDRQFIEVKLNVAMIDQYGCRETWAIGTRRDNGAFDIISENVVVELLDSCDQPIRETGKQGRVIITSLHQKLFPIIRYDLGDLAAWEDSIGGRLQLTNYRQHNILYCKGREVDGAQIFKKIIDSARKSTGHMQLRYVQIRQMTPDRFMLAVDQSAKARQLCETLNKICQSHECFSSAVSFELKELSGSELDREIENKPALFTTKYLSQAG